MSESHISLGMLGGWIATAATLWAGSSFEAALMSYGLDGTLVAKTAATLVPRPRDEP